MLSEYLRRRVAHLHVVEVDPALEPALRDALDPFANATLHLADAMSSTSPRSTRRPRRSSPTCPTGSRPRAILRTIEELPGATRWVAMAQREVGERLAAAPGTRAYGLPSVLAQLACDVRVARPVSRTVFHPVPNVDSVLWRSTAAARRPRRTSASSRAPPLRTGARRSPARWPWRRARPAESASAPGRRSRRWACRRTRERSAWRRSEFEALARALT